MSMLMKMIVNGSTGPMIMRKGGGGGGTSSSGIDPEFKPHLRRGLEHATTRLDEELGGEGARVARIRGAEREGIEAGKELSRDALEGRGAFDNRGAVDRQLRNLQGQQVASGLGTLGSARADRARQAALADQSLQLQQLDQQNRLAGAAGLTQAGAQERAEQQRIYDAPHQSLDRYFGYLSGAPQQTTTSQSGGK